MKLITKSIEAALLKAPIKSQENVANPPILVKFFTPWSNWTWFVIEGEKQQDGDWLFFGMVHGHERELGYFVLSELQSVRGPAGLLIERDLHYEGHFLNEVR